MTNGRVQRALDGDRTVLATRAVQVDDIRIRAGGSGRDVVAYAAVWMSPAEIVDSEGHYREQNAPTSMNRSLSERAGRIYSVYNHGRTLHGTPSESDSVPIGKPLEITPDKRGLLTVTRYNKSPRADEVLEAIRSGSLNGMSYTGVFLQSDPPLGKFEQYRAAQDGSLTLVTRQEIALIEYGPTPNPAFHDAEILTVRAQRERELAEAHSRLGTQDVPFLAEREPEREVIEVVGPVEAESAPEAASDDAATDVPPEASQRATEAPEGSDDAEAERAAAGTMGSDMPYSMMEDTDACSVSKPWAVKNKDTGKVHGCHANKDDAQKQMAALMSAMKNETSSAGRDPENDDAHARASVDTSAWDGNAAMSSANSGSDYAAICAGRKSGPADERGSWALPHHKSPGSPPNAAAVRNALARLSQTQGLTNREAARRHLEAHMASIQAAEGNSSSSSGRNPAPGTERTEPHHSHSAATTMTNRSNSVDNDRQTMTVEERVARQSDIRARLAEIDTEFSGAELPEAARSEWRALQEELVTNERAIADASQRAEYLRYINDVNPPGVTERVDNTLAGLGYAQPPPFGGRMGSSGPALHVRDNIFDLAAIRNRARSMDEIPVLYREYAMRAVEQARYPGVTGQRGAPTREDAQTRIAHLLDTIDDEYGNLARRILTTGSQTYDRAFGKMVGRQSIAGLSAEESRALSLGTDAAGGFAVPFQLDPTLILSSNGVVNPLRQIARVETITGKEWDGLTSLGVSVSRGTEAQEVGTGDPVFVQPTVRTSRVMGWIPFSIELDVTWNALRTQLTTILQDAKDTEEATAFTTGNGTAPNPSGVVATLGTASRVQTAGSGALAAGDIYLLENAMAPRFISNSSIVASKTIFNKFRALFQAQASAAGDPFARPSGTMGAQFNGYPKYELSAMATTTGTADLVMLQGDFSQFLIVDRVGMGIELVPQLLGSNRRPTGERGVFALWFNNSKILVDNAFRLLQIKST